MKRITCTPGVQGGEPCIAGTRTPVRSVVIQYYQIYPYDSNRVLAALPHLSFRQLCDALCYYGEHREEIDGIIRENEEALAALMEA